MQTRYNSTIPIKSKTCKCGCGKSGQIFSHGLLYECWKKAHGKHIAKVSQKRSVLLQEDVGWRGNELKTAQHRGELQRWFEARRLEMIGRCAHCGGRTCKDAANYKCSIAHILPKSHFPSVATHPLNWIELCFWGNSCHTNFDNYMLDITELNCFDTVIERFIAIYPNIEEKEKRRIPDALLNYINIDL